MPNWCENEVELICPPEDLAALKALLFNAEGKLSFEVARPMPADIHRGDLPLWGEERREKHGDRNWFDWRLKNWGTKWDVNPDAAAHSAWDGGIELRFETAWAPPNAWLDAVAAGVPTCTITLTCNEAGAEFEGRTRWENGERTFDLLRRTVRAFPGKDRRRSAAAVALQAWVDSFDKVDDETLEKFDAFLAAMKASLPIDKTPKADWTV